MTRPRRTLAARAIVLLVSLASGSTASADDVEEVQSLDVTATAYNSVPEQTNGQPRLTAWGDRLEPGMRVIAVSRDLIELGLEHGVAVEIDGLPHHYIVRDKMARRWKRKIDIYMGDDVSAARRWGKRRVTIRWRED